MTLSSFLLACVVGLIMLGAAALLGWYRPAWLALGPRPATWVVTALAVVGSQFASSAATGLGTADHVYRALLAAVVTLGASRAPRWVWLVSTAAVSVSVAGSSWQILAFGACGLVVGTEIVHKVGSFIGVAAGGAVSQVLFHLARPHQTYGATILAGLVAMLLVIPLLRRPGRGRIGLVALAGVTGLVWLACGAGSGLALLRAKPAAETGTSQAQAGLRAARAGQPTEAATDLTAARASLGRALADMNSWWARSGGLVPVVGQNYSAVRTLAEQAEDVAEQGAALAASADPSRLRLSRGTLKLAGITALGPPVRASRDSVEAASRAIDQVPRVWLLSPVTTREDQLRSMLDRVGRQESTLAEAVDELPGMLGADGERRWLVAVLDTAENRGGGGLFGAFVELDANNGHLSLGRLGSDLDLSVPPDGAKITGPAGYLSLFGTYNPGLHPVNTFFSPDFPEDAEVAMEGYPQWGGQPVQGVIGIDARGLASLLQLTGPVDDPEWPVPISAANVTPVLMHDEYLAYAQKGLRKDFLIRLARLVFDRLTSENLPGPSAIAQVLGPAVAARGIQIYSPTPREEALLSRVGASGSLHDYSSDYLDVVTQNDSLDKADWFMHRDIDYQPDFDSSTGSIKARLSVAITSTEPASGQPTYVIGGGVLQTTPAGYNREWVNVYSALALDGATLDGALVSMTSARDGGRNVYSAFVTIPPGGRVDLVLNLAGHLTPGSRYSLVIDHQPAPQPDHLIVDATGAEAGHRVRYDGTFTKDLQLHG